MPNKTLTRGLMKQPKPLSKILPSLTTQMWTRQFAETAKLENANIPSARRE
jgi:hypothetical protein